MLLLCVAPSTTMELGPPKLSHALPQINLGIFLQTLTLFLSVPINGTLNQGNAQWQCQINDRGMISLSQGANPTAKCDGHSVGRTLAFKLNFFRRKMDREVLRIGMPSGWN